MNRKFGIKSNDFWLFYIWKGHYNAQSLNVMYENQHKSNINYGKKKSLSKSERLRIVSIVQFFIGVEIYSAAFVETSAKQYFKKPKTRIEYHLGTERQNSIKATTKIPTVTLKTILQV